MLKIFSALMIVSVPMIACVSSARLIGEPIPSKLDPIFEQTKLDASEWIIKHGGFEKVPALNAQEKKQFADILSERKTSDFIQLFEKLYPHWSTSQKAMAASLFAGKSLDPKLKSAVEASVKVSNQFGKDRGANEKLVKSSYAFITDRDLDFIFAGEESSRYPRALATIVIAHELTVSPVEARLLANTWFRDERRVGFDDPDVRDPADFDFTFWPLFALSKMKSSPLMSQNPPNIVRLVKRWADNFSMIWEETELDSKADTLQEIFRAAFTLKSEDLVHSWKELTWHASLPSNSAYTVDSSIALLAKPSPFEAHKAAVKEDAHGKSINSQVSISSGIGFVVIQDEKTKLFCSVPAVVEESNRSTVWIADSPTAKGWMKYRGLKSPPMFKQWARIELKNTKNFDVIYLNPEAITNCEFKDRPSSNSISRPTFATAVAGKHDILTLTFSSPIDPKQKAVLLRTFQFVRRAADDDCPYPEEQLYRGVRVETAAGEQITTATPWEFISIKKPEFSNEIKLPEFSQRLVSTWTMQWRETSKPEINVQASLYGFEFSEVYDPKTGVPNYTSLVSMSSAEVTEKDFKSLGELNAYRILNLKDGEQKVDQIQK